MEKEQCKKCYGKGYSTRAFQEIGSNDFGGEGYKTGIKIEKKECSCIKMRKAEACWDKTIEVKVVCPYCNDATYYVQYAIEEKFRIKSKDLRKKLDISNLEFRCWNCKKVSIINKIK